MQYVEEYRVVDQIYQEKPREKAKNIWFCAKIRLDFSKVEKNTKNMLLIGFNLYIFVDFSI